MRTTRQTLLLMTLLAALAFGPGCSDDDNPAGPGTPEGPTILVLGDGGTEDHVKQTLKGAGFTVRDGGKFHEFKGAGLEGADAVILLAGVEYNNDMDDTGEAALVAFVGNGGGLVATEWLNYSISRSNYHQILKTILPVTYGNSYGSGSETYTVQRSSYVTKNLPDTFKTMADNQFSTLGPRSGAVQLVRGSRSGAAVVTWTRGGRVVSWNFAGEYGNGDVWNADMEQLLIDATGYVSGWGEEVE